MRMGTTLEPVQILIEMDVTTDSSIVNQTVFVV
jgi:hypothetical protein